MEETPVRDRKRQPRTPDPQLFISEADVAENVLGIHVETLAAVRRKANLPHVLLGAKIYYLRGNLDAVIAAFDPTARAKAKIKRTTNR